MKSLADLGRSEAAPAPAAPVHVQKLDTFGRAYATGKRKNAVARVWVKPGAGKITVNDSEHEVLFRAPGAADDPEAAARHWQTAPSSTTSYARFPAAVCPVRRAPCVTAFPRR